MATEMTSKTIPAPTIASLFRRIWRKTIPHWLVALGVSSLLILYPGIDVSIRNIGQQVGQDDNYGYDQDCSLDHRKITFEYRTHQESAHSWPGKYGLGDYRPTEQHRQVQSHDGNYRD